MCCAVTDQLGSVSGVSDLGQGCAECECNVLAGVVVVNPGVTSGPHSDVE